VSRILRRRLKPLLFAAILAACWAAIAYTSLAAPGQVRRDEWGVPHITAATVPELFYALGYATAEDRLLQLDVTRRKAHGQLAEIVGRDFLSADIQMRQLNLRRYAQRNLALLKSERPEVLKALLEYSRGINAYAAERGPTPEYMFLPEFAPWQPEDTLAIALMVTQLLSGDHHDELALLRAGRSASTASSLALMESAAAAVPAYPVLGDPAAIASSVSALEPSLGSNAFAVSGSCTNDGLPLVASDPHLDITLPSLWYEVWLTVPGEMDVRGVSIPGLGLVLIGRNSFCAWGLTALQADNEDVMIVAKTQAATLGAGPQPREEIIRVRDGLLVSDETVTVIDTAFGPVIEEDADNFYILCWSGFYENAEAAAFYDLNRAMSLADFEEAAGRIVTPVNLVYGDVGGNIAYLACGSVPFRSYNSECPRVVTTAEQAAAYRWSFVPPADLPRAVNPLSGFFVSCNNPPELDAGGRPCFPGNYAAGYRARRITSLLQAAIGAGETVTPELLASIQSDVHSLYAEDFLPPLLARLDSLAQNSAESAALAVLNDWDYDESADSPGALLYELLRRELLLHVWHNRSVRANTGLACLLAAQGVEWPAPDDTELRAMWAATVAAATGEGGVLKPYGEMHRLPLVHPLPFYADSSPGMLACGGGFRTVNVSSLQWKGSYFVKSFGPTARLIMQPGAYGLYRSVLPGGESGRPASPHFADQVQLYLSGGYKYAP